MAPSSAKRSRVPASERALARHKKEGAGDDPFLFGYTLGYVLQTARNWRGPIRTFHLMVNGSPVPLVGLTETRVTGAISFCADVPVTSTAPLRLEGMAQDFVPRQDLRILFVAE